MDRKSIFDIITYMWIGIVFIVLTVSARLIPHLPNFAPLVAVSLFSGVYFKNKWAYAVPLGAYILSDLLLGLHNIVFFTWGGIILIYLIGRAVQRRKTVVTVLAAAVTSSVLFFLISNFGVWLMGWYPRTGTGLLNCFMLAIPFFRSSLLADLAYTAVLFGTYEFVLARRKKYAYQTA